MKMRCTAELALRAGAAALLTQAANASYCLHEDSSLSGNETHRRLSAVEGEPHRVGVFVVPLFIIFYAAVVGLLVCLYKKLRAGPAREFAALQAEGKIIEDEIDADEVSLDYDSATSGWMGASIDEIRKNDGLDAALYLTHNKHMAMYCLAQFCTMGLVLLATYRLGGDYEGVDDTKYPDSGWFIWAWSYANLAGPADTKIANNAGRWLTVLASWWCIASIVIFVLFKQKSMNAFKLDEEGSHQSKFTVWVTGLSIKNKQETIQAYVNLHFADRIAKASLVWDVNKLGHNVRAQRNKITAANALSEQAKLPSAVPGAHLAKVAALKAEIDALKAEEKVLRVESKDPNCAGSVFLTFNTTVQAAEFRKSVVDGSLPEDDRLNTFQWETKLAPRPAEMYWENFGVDASEASANMFKSIGLTICMYIIFIFVSCGAVFFIGFEYMYYLYAMPSADWVMDTICPLQDSMGYFLWVFCALVFVLLFLILEEEMAPIVKFIAKYESPLTKSMKQSAYMGKCYWFYVIYHMVLSTTILGWLAGNVKVDADFFIDTQQGMNKLYVESIGAFHQHRVFLTVGIIDMIHVMEGASFFPRTTHTLTAKEEAKFTSAEDEDEDDQAESDSKDKFFCDKFDFTRNYGETIGVFTSICYYQVMHPTILFCGFAYYMAKFYIDKYQICCQYSKGHIQYGRRARTTTTYILWSMTIGQVCNVVYYCLLTGDWAVGAGMFVGLLVALGILMVHTYSPQSLRAKKSTTETTEKLTVARANSVDDDSEQDPEQDPKQESEQDPEQESETGGTKSEQLVYAPPMPDDLQVGVELSEDVLSDAGAGSRATFANPIDESTEEPDE